MDGLRVKPGPGINENCIVVIAENCNNVIHFSIDSIKLLPLKRRFALFMTPNYFSQETSQVQVQTFEKTRLD